MQIKRFYILLAVISIASLALMYAGMLAIPGLAIHMPFSISTTVLFVLFCIVAFMLGKKATQSENKYRFIQVMLIIMMGKMTFSLFFVLAYVQLYAPQDKNFIFPFILNYFIFTAFEVYFLEKLAKEKVKTAQ